MPILVAYEESQKVCAALRALGYEAYSNDTEPTRGNPAWHIRGDALDVMYDRRYGWTGMVAHPVCTFMANSGAKHLYVDGKKLNGENPARWFRMRQAAEEFKMVLDAPIPEIIAENPVMLGYAQEFVGRGPDQIVQPWHFGHKEMKATGFWFSGGGTNHAPAETDEYRRATTDRSSRKEKMGNVPPVRAVGYAAARPGRNETRDRQRDRRTVRAVSGPV